MVAIGCWLIIFMPTILYTVFMLVMIRVASYYFKKWQGSKKNKYNGKILYKLELRKNVII